MVWLRRLLTGGVVAVAATCIGIQGELAEAATQAGCDAGAFYEGCPDTTAISDGTGVTVRGTSTRPGQEDSPHGAGRSRGSGRALTDAELAAVVKAVCFGNRLCGMRESAVLNPRILTAPAATPAPTQAAPAVTIDDLARFLPASATLHAEPKGWAVVGVPANFWADASAVSVSGALLGRTAQVRFTPQAYRFDYGDGAARTSAAPGASWSALGQEELTETPTSHTYRARGAVQARVTVVYSAQYRFAGGPWVRVSGAVGGTTPPQRVLVVVERTALTTPA